MQGERDCSGAIVTAIVERAMAATPDIRFSANRVDRPNSGFNAIGCVGWRISNTVSKNGPAAANYWAGTVAFDTRTLRRRVVVAVVRKCRLRTASRARRVISEVDGSA